MVNDEDIMTIVKTSLRNATKANNILHLHSSGLCSDTTYIPEETRYKGCVQIHGASQGAGQVLTPFIHTPALSSKNVKTACTHLPPSHWMSD